LPNLIEAIIGGEEVVITRENQPCKTNLISRQNLIQFGGDRAGQYQMILKAIFHFGRKLESRTSADV